MLCFLAAVKKLFCNKSMPQLVLPSVQYRNSYLVALKEFQAEGRDLDLNCDDISADFAGFVRRLRDKEKGIGLPKGFVPQTTYWLVADGEFLGRVSIRHQLNDNLQRIGGHIGYEIRPSQRRKGYGTLILQLGLVKAKELGLEQILVTCDVTNTGSHKIIQKAGGVLENEIAVGPGKPNKYRFWISNE